MESNGELKGYFIMLNPAKKSFPRPAAERLDLTPKFRIYVVRADPSHEEQAKKTIRIICDKILS